MLPPMTRTWTDPERRAALARGHALPPEPGRFPVESCEDFQAALPDLNRIPEGERASVRGYLTRRALALGCPLPETWRVRRASPET